MSDSPIPSKWRCNGHEKMWDAVIDTRIAVKQLDSSIAVLNERTALTLQILERQEKRAAEAERRRDDETARIRTQQADAAKSVARHSGTMSTGKSAIVIIISLLAFLGTLTLGIITIAR